MRFMKLALAAATLLPLTSYAVLGGAPSTGSSAPQPLKATRQSAVATSSVGAAGAASGNASYSVRESRDADGVSIREYVLPNNIVFAVSWQGPVRPNMDALLGSYFPNFVAAGEDRLSGTGMLVQRKGDLQIESAGHRGNFFGTAYLPALMPTDLRPNNLQ